MDANNCQMVNPQEITLTTGAEGKFAATKNAMLRINSTADVYMVAGPPGAPPTATRNGNSCHKILNSATTSPVEMYVQAGWIISCIPVSAGATAVVSLSELLPSF